MEPRDDVREALLQIQRKLGQAAVASATSQPAAVPQPFHTLPGAEDLPTFAAFIAHRQNRASIFMLEFVELQSDRHVSLSMPHSPSLSL